MSELIRMDYDLMERTAHEFRLGAQQLENTMQVVRSIADALENGALLGKTGDAFSDALRCRLTPAISRLRDKFYELEGDIQGALVDLRDGDTEASSRFKG